MSASSSCHTNYVIMSDTLGTVTKYSPKEYVDFSVELEYSILEELQHLDNVPKLKDFAFDCKDSSFTMDKINGVLLNTILDQNMPREESYYIFLNILAALGPIHMAGVTHGDIHGKNIILVETKDEVNTWVIGDKTFTFPSVGFKPHIIDFGLGFLKDIPFRADLCVSDAGFITSISENQIGDIVSLVETMAYNQELETLFETVYSTITNTTTKFTAIESKVTKWLKNHSYTKKHHFKFLTGELYGLVRCFPEISEGGLDKQLSKFLKFIDKHCKRKDDDSSSALCKKIKLAHFEQTNLSSLGAGAFVINHIISLVHDKSIALVMDRYKTLPFTNVVTAIEYFQAKYNTITETNLRKPYP